MGWIIKMIFSLFQDDLSSFLLQHSPDGQPIYEEIQTIRSEQNSDYVDTTSGYHTLSIDSNYSENERGLFLVPVSSHNTPLIVSKVPGRKTNKQFFTFHSKTLGKKEPSQKQNNNMNCNEFKNLDNFQHLDHQNKTKCG